MMNVYDDGHYPGSIKGKGFLSCQQSFVHGYIRLHGILLHSDDLVLRRNYAGGTRAVCVSKMRSSKVNFS